MQKLKNEMNIAVWLVMIIMLMPAFFILPQKNQNVSIDSKVKSLTQSKENYYTSIPSRAVTLTQVIAYKDASMTQKIGEIPRQKQLEIINLKENMFELANHTFVKADPKMIGSDVLLKKEEQKISVYTAKTAEVYYSPFTTNDKEVYTKLPEGQKLLTNQVATTHWGTYYEVNFNGGQTGWISKENLRFEDPKMLQAQEMLKQKYDDS